jgi:peptidoglycan/LPS O-acetylase OafA/YrhL
LVYLAELSVRTFFIISGYLISFLLLKDRDRIVKGTLSRRDGLLRFYIRRVFRIMPAAYLLILVVIVLSRVGRLHLLPGDRFAATTFTTNFHEHRAWWLGHLWSLAIEEQFYLFWPAVVLLFGRTRAQYVAAAAVVVAPATRVIVWYLVPEWRGLTDEAFPMVFDCLATGCILAAMREVLDRNEWYLQLLRSREFIVVPAVVFAAAWFSSHPKYDLVIGQFTQNLGIALIVDRCIRYPQTLSGRLLNSRPLVLIGSLSYSLFLWQQLFLNRHSTAWSAAFPVNLLLSIAVAVASYRLVEKPFLRVRAQRFAAIGANAIPAASASTPVVAAAAPTGHPAPIPVGGPTPPQP